MNGKETRSDKYSLRTLVLAAVLAIVASVAVAYKLGRMNSGESGDHGAVVSDQQAAPLVSAQQEKPVTLVTKPAGVVLPSEKAMLAKAAIKRGDFATAQQLGAEMLSRSELQYWRFYPFNVFVDEINDRTDEEVLENMNEWLEQDGNSALAYLIRAGYYYNYAWTIRGNRYSREVPKVKLELFEKYIEMAAADALKAVHLDPENPLNYSMLLTIYSARGDTSTMEHAFQWAIEKFPKYYPLYQLRLDTLAPKWGGSLEKMYDFADKYAGGSPEDSPLRLLYVQLYRMMLNAASAYCSSYEGDYQEKCIVSAMDATVTGDFIDNVNSAFDLYNKTDRHQFSQAVGPILSGIVRTAGAGHVSGVLLQSAASRMGSQLQLVDNNPGKNNYMLDDLAASSWYLQGNYENAEKKWREALLDIENTVFPSPEEKFEAIASIYGGLTSLYNKTSQYAMVIAYQDAATRLRGGAKYGEGHMTCYAYFKLKKFDEAVRECNEYLEGGADTETFWWRAMAYKALRQSDAELQDLHRVANSENHHFRTSAAIEISVVYGDRKDMVAMLEALNSYPFLFDEETQTKRDLAIVYNNRCYAQMQLGRLQEALNDCTTSLKYDNLPDAYQKYQALTQRLASPKPKSL